MRTLLLLALIVVGLVAAGVIHFQKQGDNNIQISVDKEEFKKDADKVLKVGAKLVHDAEESLNKSTDTK